MSLTVLVPADDSLPIVLRELSEGATVSAQARRLFDGLWEVVRARGLHQLAPELWPVMLVENGLRAHQLRTSRPALAARAAAIAGDVLICQERRTSFSVDELRGFTQEEAARLRSRLSSDRTGARLTRRGTARAWMVSIRAEPASNVRLVTRLGPSA